MRLQLYKLFTVLIYLYYVAALEQINSQIRNKNVDRTIDLTSQLAKISSIITLENTGNEPVREFLIPISAGTVGNLSYIGAKDSLKQDLKIQVLVPSSFTKEGLYKIQLKSPIENGRTAVVTVEQVFAKALVPYPNSITQKDRQLVRYFGNHYFLSPYTTEKQKTEVKLPAKSLESNTKLKPTSQTDSSVSYGPYGPQNSFASNDMIIHFENNAPFLTVTRLERLIDVSHWGNIAIEENIEIKHTGAKLTGPFSRYDYQRDSGSSHHSIKSYRTILPGSAHSIYYRDSNGNISTSSVRPHKDWIDLELRPRFPLFGGWQSSYTLGYSVPSYQFLFKNPNGEFTLSVRLLDHVFDDMHVEELETAVILPVGVSNIKIETPYEAERLEDGVTYKYLDNIGRTVIRLRKENLVEQHIQDLEISYSWQPHLLLHEPILLAIALFILFIVVIIYVRLDFSIAKPEHSKKE